MRICEYYQEKSNRDKRYRELKEQGFNVLRRSHKNQLLHPMYVEDYERKLTPDECGFGNTLYKTYFPTLYVVEEIKIWIVYN